MQMTFLFYFYICLQFNFPLRFFAHESEFFFMRFARQWKLREILHPHDAGFSKFNWVFHQLQYTAAIWRGHVIFFSRHAALCWSSRRRTFIQRFARHKSGQRTKNVFEIERNFFCHCCYLFRVLFIHFHHYVAKKWRDLVQNFGLLCYLTFLFDGFIKIYLALWKKL
jgi:hypothetical protein